MSTANTRRTIEQGTLRLWPGILAGVLLCVLGYAVPFFIPDALLIGMIGGLVCSLAILVWWLFLSRAPWLERLGVLVLTVLAVVGTTQVIHKSLANAGMGVLFYITAIPILTLAIVLGVILGRRSTRLRRVALVVTILLACGAFTLLRTDGVMGEGGSQFAWRWSTTSEERLLADAANQPKLLAPGPIAIKKDAEWPGFRGPSRDGVVRGIRIKTDWSTSPPVLMWRRPIGPGWSSFAVSGEHFYTQEQRGEEEIVACHKVATGEPVWRHSDKERFWESNAGAGPRATPTLHNGRVYAFGATGILNALEAGDGAVVWSRNVAGDSKTKVPTWGFSSSPLVLDDLVIVAAGGKLVAYELATGKLRWVGPAKGTSYSSPHRVTINGVAQIVLLSDTGATSVAPVDGSVLWEHAWQGGAIVQPALMADGDIIINAISATGGLGTRRLGLAHGPTGWAATEAWTSTGLKPYYNDFVVHKNHAFGFDGSVLACINLPDGKRVWKGGRYGNGQLVLLPDQDLLLVLSEKGDLALVSATPDQFKEITRYPAIKGKTWNHPVLVGENLLVRNDQEMAAFRLSLMER